MEGSCTSSDRHRPPDDLRVASVRIVEILTNAGHVAYFAGGCVRDRLMNHEPDDYDVATDARPDQIRARFHNTQAVGESFGVVLVRMMGYTIQVATFRTEGEYTDGRHPDLVRFSDAEHDASRRDFTINGLFENPLTDEVIDYVGGRADLESRLVRAIGNPHDRLREDRLRMLRAVRFASRFEFDLEQETADAIREWADQLQGVSRERIGQEIRRMLLHPNRAVAAWEIQYLGLDMPVFNEPNRTCAPLRLGKLPDEIDFPTALAAWLLDRFEESDGLACVPEVIDRWTAALVLSNAERIAMIACSSTYESLRGPWPTIGVARQKRLAAGSGFEAAMLILRSVDGQRFVDVRRRVEELAQTGLSPQPLITGDDLVEMGLVPGPLFRRVLNAVYDAQLEGTVTERQSAISLVGLLCREG